jgi:hypothetical protein
MFCYFLAGARGLPGGVTVFFGDGPWWAGFAFWSGAALLLSLPFAVLWSRNSLWRPWLYLLAVLVAVVPPLGLIGWISPLSGSGALFPGLGWIGLLLMAGLSAAFVVRSVRWSAGVLVLAFSANVVALYSGVAAPARWSGVDTHFSRLGSGGADDAGQVLGALRRVQWVGQFAASVPVNSVVVLPETVVGSLGADAALNLSPADEALAARGSRVLVGAELPLSDGRYENALYVLGAKKGEQRSAVQSIPVPVSMWKPWARDGAVADVFGNGGLLEVGGVRAATFICYEQLLSFSLLKAMMMGKPDVIVGAANLWWVTDRSIPIIQKQMLGWVGRLFGVGVVTAGNY